MTDIVKKIVKERDESRNHLEECLDLLTELDKRYDLNETDSEYIKELIDREEGDKKVDVEVDLDDETYGYLLDIAYQLGLKKEEVAEKAIEIYLEE